MDYPNKTWLSLRVTVQAAAAEAIESALNEIGAIGTEINLLGVRDQSADTDVIGYFTEKPDEGNLKAQLLHGLRIYGYGETALRGIQSSPVEDRDWLAEWKKHWKATEAGKFIIAPPWEHVAQTDKILIRIEPNMAFGTGTHETTRLCLEAISDIYRPDQTFLDVGTGTGILAIAAAKSATRNTEEIRKGNRDVPVPSVAKILACDTDADSVRIARENAASNGVGDNIECFEGSVNAETEVFDFVCANLTIDLIVPLLSLLIGKARSVLLLSGILVEQQDILSTELRKFEISNFRCQSFGEWISITVEK